MDYFKNKVCVEVEFVSEWPDTAEKGLSEMKSAISKWAAKKQNYVEQRTQKYGS